MNKVEVYTKDYCPHCKATKATLHALGVEFIEFDVTHDTALEHEMRQRSQRRTVPQTFINEKHVGGNDDLQSALSAGDLEEVFKLKTHCA